MKRLAPVLLTALLLLSARDALAEAQAGRNTTPPGNAATLQKLDLNRATAAELQGVPGIGPRMAQAIVDLRTKQGSIKKLEELLLVRGIKEKKLKSLASYLDVVPTQSAASNSLSR